jgi:outer membrane immunogenic protein
LSIEGDLQGTSLNRSVSFSSNLVSAFFPAVTTAGEKMDFFATLRGRVGITASPMLLLYVIGGLAVGDPQLTSSVTTSPVGPAAAPGCAGAGFCGAATSSNDWRAGWTVGAGAEWKLNQNWSVKGEYL